MNAAALTRSRAAFAVSLGLIGFLLNVFEIPLAAGTSLVVGNLAYIIVAARLGPAWSLVAALITVIPFTWHWGHPNGFIVFGLEAMVVAWLRGRGLRVFHGVALFWLLIGMPLAMLLVRLRIGPVPLEHMMVIGVKQFFNGLSYGALAAVLLLVLGPRLHGPWTQQPMLNLGLRPRLVYAILAVSVLVTVSSTLLVSARLLSYQEMLVNDSLDEVARSMARRVEGHVDSHSRGISMLAEMLSRSTDRDTLLQPMLDETHRLHPGFLTMLGADASGLLIAGSPAERMAGAPASSVADREYFRKAMQREGVFVSDVFVGRGFGSDAIVAIARAFRHGPTGPAVGIVEGSLDLSAIPRSAGVEVNGETPLLILCDARGQVLSASKELGFEPLSTLGRYLRDRPYAPGTVSYLTPGGEREFLARRATLPNGWTVDALISYAGVLGAFNREYLVVFVMLAIAMAAMALLADRAAWRITAPLEQLARDLAAQRAGTDGPGLPGAAATDEIGLLRQELEHNMRLAATTREQLESQVMARTQELQRANEMLQSLATNDSLTGLCNRRVLEARFPVLRADARRENRMLAVAMIDLDHFGNLGRAHGRAATDQCLNRVAALLKREFLHESDILCRYAGDRFVVVTACADAGALQGRLQGLRSRIAETDVLIDNGEVLRVTVSIGALLADPGYGAWLEDWLRAADTCLRRAKGSGRNTVVLDRIVVTG